MVRLVSNEVSKEVHEICGEVLPGGWRDCATSSGSEPDQFNKALVAARKRTLQLRWTNRPAINRSRHYDPVLGTDHLDPHAPGVVNVRCKHSNGAARRARNILRPQLSREVFNQIGRYAMICPPRRNQVLAVFGIFRHLISSIALTT
jgi:hypothetical protein